MMRQERDLVEQREDFSRKTRENINFLKQPKANFFFFFLRFYLFIHERHTKRQRHGQREKQALCREPDVGLNPGTPGSCPGPKADRHSTAEPSRPSFIN